MKISWLKRFLSYFFVVTLKKIPSKYNPTLCLQLEAGKLLLNTKNANYSYGNLHKIFEITFKKIELQKINPQKVLILGLGAGSVIRIIQQDYNLNPQITAVEIDSEVIKVLKSWQNLNLNVCTIIEGDALQTLDSIKEKYELVIVDLFSDLQMPSYIFSFDFIVKIKKLMSINSICIVNCIVKSKQQKHDFDEYKIELSKHFKTVKIHEVLDMNHVVELRL